MDKVKIEANPEAFSDAIGTMKDEPLKVFKRIFSSITVAARGRTFEAHAEYVTGDPWLAETRMPDEQLTQKFRNFCFKIIPASKIEKAAQLIWELEKLHNVAELAELLTQAS